MERQEQSAGPTGPEGGSDIQEGNNGDLQGQLDTLLNKLIFSRRTEDWRRGTVLSAGAQSGDGGVPELWEFMPKVAKDFEFDRTQDHAEPDGPPDGEGPGLDDLDGVPSF